MGTTELEQELEELVERQKTLSVQIGERKRAGGDAEDLIRTHAQLSERVSKLEEALSAEGEERQDLDAGQLTVDIVTVSEDFERLRDEWHRLEEDSESFSVFMSWEWMHSWWQVYGGGKQLHIVTVRDGDGRLVGLLPLMVTRGMSGLRRRPELALIGTGERVKSDYLGWLTAAQHRGEVTEALLEALTAGVSSLGLAVLRGLGCERNGGGSILLGAPVRDMAVGVSADAVTVHGPLLGKYPDFLANVPSKTRRKRLRNRPKRLDEDFGTVTCETVVDPGDFEDALDALSRFSIEHFGRGILGSAWADRRFREFMGRSARVMAERGIVRLDRLIIDGSPAAVAIGYPYGDTYFSYQASFAPELAEWEPGHCLFAHIIQELISEGILRFEFGRGAHDYKTEYFEGRSQLVEVRLVPQGSRGLARLGSSLIFQGVTQSAKSFVSDHVATTLRKLARAGRG